MWDAPKTTHTIGSTWRISILWQREFYATATVSDVCAAMDGRLFVAGSERRFGYTKMMAIDGRTGEILWSKKMGSVFTVSQDRLFATNLFKLEALSPVDGKTIWSTSRHSGGRLTGDLLYFESKLFVKNGYSVTVVSPVTGDIIASYDIDDFRQSYPQVLFSPYPTSSGIKPHVVGKDVILSHEGLKRKKK